MGKVLSAIGSKRDGTVEFMLMDEKNPTHPFIFFMPPEDAYRLSNKLKEAADKARRGIEDRDVSGDRENYKGCYGENPNNKTFNRRVNK